MFDPPVDQTSFIELFNTQNSYAFDLSGWRVNGLSYTFPDGAVLPGRSFLVLARNRGEFAKLYGGTRPCLRSNSATARSTTTGKRFRCSVPARSPARSIGG